VNVVLIEPTEIEGDEARITGVRVDHVRDVLHAEVGTTIKVGVVDGALGTAVVLAFDDHHVRLRLALGEVPPVPDVDVILALPRPKVLARLYSPIAQLGVRRLMLTGAYKVEKSYFDTHVLTEETWRPLLLEGLAQSKDTRVPVVTVHRSPTWLVREELAALVPEPALRLVAHPGATTSLRTAATAATGPVTLAIGPEGGWAPREERLFAEHGFTQVALGARTLRSDVATIALLSILHDTLSGARR
jgi:16S rRNA (uracil1498-N3)-methyltransferase